MDSKKPIESSNTEAIERKSDRVKLVESKGMLSLFVVLSGLTKHLPGRKNEIGLPFLIAIILRSFTGETDRHDLTLTLTYVFNLTALYTLGRVVWFHRFTQLYHIISYQ